MPAAPSIAPAIMAISKPPYSRSASAAASFGAVRADACCNKSRFFASPASSRPVPRPVRSATADPKTLAETSAAEAVFPIPISPKIMTSLFALSPSAWPCIIALSYCSTVIAASTTALAVPSPNRRLISEGWFISPPFTPASTTLSETPEERANTADAAPPSRILSTICRVTSCG